VKLTWHCRRGGTHFGDLSPTKHLAGYLSWLVDQVHLRRGHGCGHGEGPGFEEGGGDRERMLDREKESERKPGPTKDGQRSQSKPRL
jgi:hypothetical protein